MLTDARIMAIVPVTDLMRSRQFYGQTLGLSESDASIPGPWAIYRCGRGTLLEIYERPTAGEAQHTLASWEVSDVRAVVEQLRKRGVRFEDYDLPTPSMASLATFTRRGFAIPTATSSASIPGSSRSRLRRRAAGRRRRRRSRR
jgi:catechol 2,3-dioxygenase-like lactoylglutathione lyase family enzyme